MFINSASSGELNTFITCFIPGFYKRSNLCDSAYYRTSWLGILCILSQHVPSQPSGSFVLFLWNQLIQDSAPEEMNGRNTALYISSFDSKKLNINFPSNVSQIFVSLSAPDLSFSK